MTRYIIVVIIALLHCCDVTAIEIIANRNVPDLVMDKAKLRQIYNLRTHKWSDGTSIRVFIMPKDNYVHERFTVYMLGIYPYQLQRTIDRAAFSGILTPVEVANEQDMVKQVAQTPGAIGYVSRTISTENINVIRIK